MTTIYHNPRCSKSRQTLALLEENGIDVNIIKYLENPPSFSELSTVIEQLSITPRELLRKGEDAYKEHNLKDASLSDEDIINAMLKSPKLIERPIVIHRGKAKIGRPPESIMELFA